ncbi:MAG TPA: OmpA family protein [Anaeromyxobacter sp.]|nr:OmpA family protein [Anaeromyxobacter sp.]
MTTLRTIALSLALLAGAGCASAGKRTAIGAGGGAAVGAGVGAAVGGWKGAAVGALAGGAVGGSVGLYLDRQAKELEKVAETRRTENGILVRLKSDILFETDSAVLRPAAVDQLTKVGDILARYPEDRIRVEGYADSTGSARHNEELSERRAQAVRRVLLGRGVKEQQVTALGMGETRPVSTNANAAGRARNRRVELHIDVPGEKVAQAG